MVIGELYRIRQLVR